MLDIVITSLVFSFFLSYTIKSFFVGHIYLPKSAGTKENFHLWGKKTDSTHLSGMSARATSGLLLLILLTYLLMFMASIDEFTNSQMAYIIICSIIGSIAALVNFEMTKRKWLRQQGENVISIKTDP